MKAKVTDIKGKNVGDIELSDEIFSVKPSKPLLYDIIKMQLANRRKGCASTRGHGDVSGTTAKMYRQKGTGRARHGDERANIFVGGGKSFGPHQRDYSYRLPKKARRSGIRAALSLKRSEDKLLILDDFPIKAIKTKDAVDALKTLGVNSGLIIYNGGNESLEKSVRNITGVKLVRTEGVNAYDLIRHEHTIILKDSLDKIQEVLKP